MNSNDSTVNKDFMREFQLPAAKRKLESLRCAVPRNDPNVREAREKVVSMENDLRAAKQNLVQMEQAARRAAIYDIRTETQVFPIGTTGVYEGDLELVACVKGYVKSCDRKIQGNGLTELGAKYLYKALGNGFNGFDAVELFCELDFPLIAHGLSTWQIETLEINLADNDGAAVLFPAILSNPNIKHLTMNAPSSSRIMDDIQSKLSNVAACSNLIESITVRHSGENELMEGEIWAECSIALALLVVCSRHLPNVRKVSLLTDVLADYSRLPVAFTVPTHLEMIQVTRTSKSRVWVAESEGQRLITAWSGFVRRFPYVRRQCGFNHVEFPQEISDALQRVMTFL